MAIMNLRQWRKAYMIEFLKNDKVEEVFTFSIPPESENFEFPQRVSETKTFGGVVIDDYGNDTVKIRLSGSTVNEERKLIYRGNKKLPAYLTGEKEIFALQKLFEEWGEIENIANKKLYLYDLSKMNLLQIGAGAPARNYWRIIIKNLKVRKSKDKPYTYLYDLEAIGIEEEHKFDALFGEGFGGLLETISKIIGMIQTAIEIMEMAGEMIASVVEAVAEVIDFVVEAVEEVKKYVEIIASGDINKIIEGTIRRLPGGNGLLNATKTLVNSCEKFGALFGGPESTKTGSYAYSHNEIFSVRSVSGTGDYVTPIKVAFGNKALPPADPVKERHKFVGWYSDPAYSEPFDFDLEEITQNIALYAKWEQTEAVIAFNSNHGSPVESIVVPIGSTVEAPDPPTKTGYALECWCADSDATEEFDFSIPITGDITLYARWKIVYAVTFHSNGGSLVQQQIVSLGDRVIYPITPARDNYLFAMWCSDPGLASEYDFNSPVDSNLHLFAKWTLVSSEVSFECNGGTAIENQTVKLGEYAVEPENPVKDGYAFLGWYRDALFTQEFIFESTAINSNATLYAKWQANEYTVSFNSNGGSGIPPQEIEHGKLVIFPLKPAREGFLFVHWCADEELSAEFDFSISVTADAVLYAKWEGE